MEQRSKRVEVFIDHSNVMHRLIELERTGVKWPKWYDPKELGVKLSGGRTLTCVNFYCAPPPSYLLQEGERGKVKYWKQMSYYEAIKKIPEVNIKFASLKGSRGDMHEKNLDTQLCTDMIVKASTNEYDVAIIISNDGDFVSAAEAIKNMGRKVELVYFGKKCSMDMKRIADVSRRTRQVHFTELSFDVRDGESNPI